MEIVAAGGMGLVIPAKARIGATERFALQSAARWPLTPASGFRRDDETGAGGSPTERPR
jgi:hypothetical protein